MATLVNFPSGVAFGLLGMLGFSGTLVATKAAVAGFSPITITSARIVIAAVLAWLTLSLLNKRRLPARRLMFSIIWMGLGVAVGFPFFVALAVDVVPSAHGAVVVGLAPAITAIIAFWRLGERPKPLFWLASIVGFCCVLFYAFDAGGGYLSLADGWLFIALLCVGSAYVEGGRVAAELGGTITLCWAMVFLALPALIVLIWSIQDLSLADIPINAWVGLAYTGVISMFLASVFWYQGLAAGGVARIGQINLILPVFALLWSAIILHEAITITAIVCAIIVFCAMVVCLRAGQEN